MTESELSYFMIDYLIKNSNRTDDVSVLDILKIVIPVVSAITSTIIAYFLGNRQAVKMLSISKRQEVIERQIKISNDLIIEFIGLCKQLENIKTIYRNAIENDADPLRRLFITRSKVQSEIEISIKPNEISFINKFKKVIGEDAHFGISTFTKVSILINNIKILGNAYAGKVEVGRKAQEIFKENASGGLGLQDMSVNLNIHDTWEMLYVNESFLKMLDEVYFACLDFITSYPSVAKNYFLALKIDTGEEPIKNAEISYEDIETYAPITKPDWGLVAERLEQSEENLKGCFRKSDYSCYIDDYKSYIKQFKDRN